MYAKVNYLGTSIFILVIILKQIFLMFLKTDCKYPVEIKKEIYKFKN